jgi:hypothetical protein
MATRGTLIKTINITNARIAMAVDDCIGQLAPSSISRRPSHAWAARNFWVLAHASGGS